MQTWLQLCPKVLLPPQWATLKRFTTGLLDYSVALLYYYYYLFNTHVRSPFKHLYKILDPLRLTHTHSPAYSLSLLNSIPSLTKHPQSSPYHPPYLLIKPPQPRLHSSHSMAHPPPISPPVHPSLHHTVWPTVRGSTHQEQIHRQNLHPTFQSSAKTWSYKEIRSSV